MARVRKELAAPEKKQAEWVARFFQDTPIPLPPNVRTAEQNKKIRENAKKLHLEFAKKRGELNKVQKKDTDNYPPLRPVQFPSFEYFAAYMLEQYEDLRDTWAKRFETGKMSGAQSQTRLMEKARSKLTQALELLKIMKAGGMDVDLDSIMKQFGITPEEQKIASEPAAPPTPALVQAPAPAPAAPANPLAGFSFNAAPDGDPESDDEEEVHGEDEEPADPEM